MRSRVCLVSVTLLSVTAGKPVSSPQPDDSTGFSDIWPSDGGLFTEPAANPDSSVFLTLNPVSSDVGYDYYMFPDSDAESSSFAIDSGEEITSNLDASCVGNSNVDQASTLDIIKSRDLLDQTWTSLEPSTNQKLCPADRDSKPPPQTPLQLPSLQQYTDAEECPPLPDGRKRQALCCYDPDVKTPSGDVVSKNCWRC